MVEVKRMLFRFRSKGTDVVEDQRAAFERSVEIPELSLTFDSQDEEDPDTEDTGPRLPKLWVGVAVASLCALGVAGYKLLAYRRAAKEAKRDEPWRQEDDEQWSHIETGTASLVGLLFIIVVSAVGKRFERDYPVEY